MDNKRALARLTAAHLQQLKTAIKRITAKNADLGQLYRELPKEARVLFFGARVWWAWCYELTALEHCALLFKVVGQLDPLRAALDQATDKNQMVLDWTKNYAPDDKLIQKLFSPKTNSLRKAIWAASSMAMTRQVECLQVEGCYMSDLVERVRNDDEKAFIKALHIDRTVVSCPSFGAMISRAELEDDKPFFDDFGKGVGKRWEKTSPQSKPEHRELRVVLRATHETGQLRKMSMTDKEKLFIQELGFFKDESGQKDNADSLLRFISRWIFNK